MEKRKPSKKPFFARFLENQELSQVNGGRTLKYPSDSDEDLPLIPPDRNSSDK